MHLITTKKHSKMASFDKKKNKHSYGSSSSTKSNRNDYSSDSENSSLSEETTIALFGIHGATGRHFVKLCLNAGYSVQALAPSKSVVSLQHSSLTIVEGTLDDAEKLAQVIENASYVVCMVGETLPNKKKETQQEDVVLNFIKLLYPLMKESCTRLFLYQANSLTIDAHGKTPVLSKVFKETSNILGRSAVNTQHDKVVKYIVEEENEYFDFIITRPGMLREGPSKKKLAASRSLPGPVPMTHVDLADFTLGALMERKLYNTCPYVVGDGF